MKNLGYISVLLVVFFAKNLTAQDLSRLRFKTFAVAKDTLKIDTLSIVNGSMIIRDKANNLIDSANYQLNDVDGVLIWKHKPPTDSIKATYRTFPFSFTRVQFRKDRSMIALRNDAEENPFAYIPSSGKGGVIDFGTLEYNGSFARGISFGTSQDVVLTSSFNLQLSGDLGRDIEVTAAITDNNIPIQPDGTTQQLQEFDKVYIQLRKKEHTLIVGDYEIGSPEGYFMKYYKKLQGGSYTGNFTIKEKHKAMAQASIAVAKGKYNRYQLPVSEGNQGPYKLIGLNGETFIIVLAGTERVFINGKLMQRGSENDYVIDYNLGEIIFTPNQLITRDLRVVVEFEYSENSYFRYLFAINAAYELEKVKFRVNFYSEQDSKNQPLDADLSPAQKDTLRAAGDNPIGILFPGYSEEEYDASRILYKIIDSDTTTSYIDTVFVYSTNQDSAKYRVIFTAVGFGNGDYNPSITTPNGRVFEYVPPENGIRKGSYIPFRILVPPERDQMITLGMDLKPSKNDFFTVEAALSNNDDNTFSEKDDKDNVGLGVKTAYNRKFRIGPETRKQFIIADVDYEFLNHNFRELERYRPVEFSRDWNYTRQDTVDEHLINGEIKFVRDEWLKVGYHVSSFLAGEAYKGLRHRGFATFDMKGYHLDANISYLSSEGKTQSSEFIRPIVEASKSFARLRGWKIGGRYEQEINKIRNNDTDTLLNSSFVYNDWRIYISTADTARDKIRFEYIRRLEFFPKNNDLRLVNSSHTANFRGNWVSNKTHKLGWQLTYRRFETSDTVAAQKELEDYYLGRIEYGLNALKGVISLNTLYELGAGKEPRISYSYIEVDPGQGNFRYLGDPKDDPKDESKFVLTDQPDQAIYIRVLNPTLDYDAVNSTQFNFSVSLNPKAAWSNKKKVKGFIARFSTVTSLQIDRKSFRDSKSSPFNPFVFDENDTALVAFNSLVRHTVFFNRTSSVYSLEYTFQDNSRKVNLVNGVESNASREHLGRLRWNIIRPLSFIVKYAFGQRSYDSKIYTNRGYFIESHEAEPQLTYLYGTKFRLTVLYKFAWRHNIEQTGGETALSHEASLDAKYSVISKTIINGKFSFVRISFDGTQNEVLEFAMLQGLKDGNNYTWTASFERYLASNVQFSLSYEGRKTGDAKAVHVGRASVRAIF